MKHLLSFVAALAATTAMSLMFASAAAAQSYGSTGNGTCTGTNADGTTATWTLAGGMAYLIDYDNPPPTHYRNYRPYGTGYCSFVLNTSGDIKPNCAGLSGKVFIHYVVYPGYGGTQQLATFATGQTLLPNYSYGRTGFSFSDLLDVTSVQYKVTSLQAGSMTTWEVATSYL